MAVVEGSPGSDVEEKPLLEFKLFLRARLFCVEGLFLEDGLAPVL